LLVLRSPILDRRRLEFSGSDHGGGLVAPSGICRSIGTLYAIALCGLDVSEAQRLKALEDENAKLKKLFAKAMLDLAVLKDVASEKW
jgi:hypothetical protein